MLMLLFCIAFGLSMDYEVIVLSRIKELHDQGLDNRTAVTDGLSRSGRIVTTAAALIAVTFFAFGTATVSFLQLFGIGAGVRGDHRRDARPRRTGAGLPADTRPCRLVRTRTAAPAKHPHRPDRSPRPTTAATGTSRQARS